MGDASNGRAPSRHFQTVDELFSAYLDRTKEGQCPRAFEERQRLLLRFRADLPVQIIADLIPDDLERWIESNTQWKSGWTRMRVCATIKRAFNWALRKGLLASNPFAGVSYQGGQTGQALTDEEFRTLLRNSDAVYRRVLFFLRWTGARPCELSALQWPFIDCQQGVAVLREHKTSKTRKDRAPRTIYLTAAAVRLLLWIRRHQRPDDLFCFLHSWDRPWNRNSLDLRFWRLRKRLGLPAKARLYGTRHAWASQLAMAGVELLTLSKLLGHTNTKTSLIYVHMAGQHKYLRSALEKGLATIDEH